MGAAQSKGKAPPRVGRKSIRERDDDQEKGSISKLDDAEGTDDGFLSRLVSIWGFPF